MSGNGQGPRRVPGPRGPVSPVARLRLPRGVRLGGRIVSGVLAAVVLGAAATGYYLDRALIGSLNTSNALVELNGGHPEADQNLLLLGLDSRKDMNGNDLPADILDKLHAGSSSDVGGYNTNTMILLHVPADGSRATAISIPRDDYVNLPGGLGQHKIKEAYGRAKAAAEDQAQANGVTDASQLEHLGREAGRKAAVEAVQDLLGVQVDHFAEINLAGFYDLANALGGVTVCLREPAHDGYSGADFPAGVQTLDGQQALAFVRQRHNLPGGDLDRTHRQQAFLASAAAKLQSAGVFGDLGKLGALLDVAQRDVVVDSGFDPLTFVREAGAVTAGNVRFYTLPIEGFATEDGESVNLVDPARIKAVTKALLAGQDPSGVTGAVGTGPQIPQLSQSASGTPTDAAVGAAGTGANGVSVQSGPMTTRAASDGHRVGGTPSAPPAARAAGRAAAPAHGAAPHQMPGAAPVEELSPSPEAALLNPPPGVPCVD